MTVENHARHKQAERDRKRALGLVRLDLWVPVNKVKEFRSKAERAVKSWLEAQE